MTYLLDDKLGSLGVLLGDLFLLDGGGEFLSETTNVKHGRSQLLHCHGQRCSRMTTYVMCV